MNEQIARDVVLVRTIETIDQKKEILSEDDRMYASRSARELAQWQASGKHADVTGDDFLQQRSDLILKRLAERNPAFAAFAKRRYGLQSLTWAMPLLALLLGVGLDRITDPHRVDLLSAPLLLIIVWNLVVYLGVLISLFIPAKAPGWPKDGMVRRLSVGKLALPRKMPPVLSTALLSFMGEWAQLSARLTAARLNRTFHLSAAMFAIGAVASLYARGLLAQYGAGWESTFLDGRQVHGLLSFIFAPAMFVFNLPGFTLAEIEALRFPQTTQAEGGARWVHLYAATIFLLVVLPRLVLALLYNWRASRLATRFPLDLDHPYFRRLNETIGVASGGMLRVLPYSFTVDEARHQGLVQLAVMAFGEQGRMMLRPSSAYGDEPQAVLREVDLTDPAVNITAVLFNVTATPEKENHGAFLDYLVKSSPRGIAVLLDESSYAERMGDHPDDRVRLTERLALWQQFCHFHHAKATVVNLLNPSAYPLEAGLPVSTAP
jgi:hypothetical protein